jgi:hypothetical protein
MRHFLESAFYLAAAIFFWAKIGSVALGLLALLYSCIKIHKYITNMCVLRSCA